MQPGGELAGLGRGGFGGHQLLKRGQDRQLAVAGGVQHAGQRVDRGAEFEVGQVAAQFLVGGGVRVDVDAAGHGER